MLYTPTAKTGVHVYRKEMAAMLKEARGIGYRGPGGSRKAVAFATGSTHGAQEPRYYTNVKGAHFVDQGLGGLVWRRGPGAYKGARTPRGGVPKWAAKAVKFSKQ